MPFENLILIIDHNLKNFIKFCLKEYILNMYLVFKVFYILILHMLFTIFCWSLNNFQIYLDYGLFFHHPFAYHHLALSHCLNLSILFILCPCFTDLTQNESPDWIGLCSKFFAVYFHMFFKMVALGRMLIT